MLRVSIHAGPLAKMSVFNRVDWLDIGYADLGPIANYKALLFTAGQGAGPPIAINAYPRWSASLWDLVARAIALALAPDPDHRSETIPALPEKPKHVAFANRISAVVEHYPAGTANRKRLLASAEVWRFGRPKGMYRARFEEDTMPVKEVDNFLFRPERMRPVELLLHAAVLRLSGQHDVMPPRPSLVVPELEKDGRKYVPLHKLPEPARTGFARWLERNSEPPEKHPNAPEGIAPEPTYALFLRTAV